MGFGSSKSLRSSKVLYKVGQKPAPGAWYRRNVGWFGHVMAMAFFISVVGGGWLARDMALNNLKEQANQASVPQPLHPPLTAETSLLAPATPIVQLQPVLDQWAKQHPRQQWGVVIKSLEGPSFDARLQPDREFESASIYKLFLTLPLFNQVSVERQTQITVKAGGQQKSIADCVDLMLRVSDNPCGEALGYYLNWKKADETLKRGGFKRTDFISRKNSLRTSAGDTANFLAALDGDMFNLPAEKTIMYSLLNQKYRSGIPAGCPGCTVANKTGDIDNVVHDAAIVTYSKGKYVLVVMSQGGSFKQIAQLTGELHQKILDTAK